MTGIIILAAGSSSRLGHPKQKIVYNGRTLLQQTVETAIHSKCNPVIVILGADAEKIHPDIEKEEIFVYHNPDWEQGMSSSIQIGITMLKKIAPHVSDAILMVSDQPFVDTALLNDLINKKAAIGKEIIACSYSNTLGVPALFNKKFFPELLLLKGQEGAKKLLIKHKESVAAIPFPLGSIDIDTVKDYQSLINTESKHQKK
ncbi:nucleotidyltransferase family protein [Segetibacter koreensis]|uniref:nucleotidyltransferase family protein n=1 Tax=Segetibacter koreensis TaxID=398037 RepID=UPI00035EB45B|nr:nucleotidyltransferase family protein [Segetibacter koreensis]